MSKIFLLAIFVLSSFTFNSSVTAEGFSGFSDPIKEIKNKDDEKFELDAKAFKNSSATKPREFASEDKAKEFFEEETWKRVSQNIDFDSQKLLLFAWQGSGKDSLKYLVAESYPEQIFFEYKRGLTKDLRTHVRIFVIRNNVKWSVK